MAIDNWRKMRAETYTRLGTVPQRVKNVSHNMMQSIFLNCLIKEMIRLDLSNVGNVENMASLF